MGTITKRTNPSGETRFRAQIRIKKQDYPDFTESRTFSKKSLASEWIKKREAEIEANPEILLKKSKQDYPTLAVAITKYLEEVNSFGRSKRMGLRFITSFPIGKIHINELTRKDYSDHVMLRRNGIQEEAIGPVAASTALGDLQYIRSVFTHARLVWGLDSIVKTEIDLATEGLKHARLIAKSTRRTRLPSNEELQALATYFYQQWQSGRGAIPCHLIMWLAIYTCRRHNELFKMRLDDFKRESNDWLMRDLKNPNGSHGNNKTFHVTEAALKIIDELLAEDVQKRMQKISKNSEMLIPINEFSFSRRFYDAIRICGIEDLHFHDLRHEGATRLAELGLNIPQIQQVTLHDSWNSLQRYVNLRKRGTLLEFDEAMRVAKAI